MRKAIRIRTLSQWHLLKQINAYLGRKKLPNEVLREIYHIISSGKLGKNGFIVLCISKIYDDYMGIAEAVGMYPYKLWMDEKIDEVQAKGRKGKIKSWYISYAKVAGYKTKIAIIYRCKIDS